MAREHLLVVGWGVGGGRGIEKSSGTSQFVFKELRLKHPGNPYHEQSTLLENTDFRKNVVNKI